MKCSNVIVPGFEETSKIKNPGLEAKIGKGMADAEKLSKKILIQENSGPLEGYDEVGAMFFNDYEGKIRNAPTKKVVLYHGTPASELEGGSFNLDAEYNEGGVDWMRDLLFNDNFVPS